MQVMTRQEWKRRFAARIVERAEWDAISALAEADAADAFLRRNGGARLDPEQAADEAMAGWVEHEGAID